LNRTILLALRLELREPTYASFSCIATNTQIRVLCRALTWDDSLAASAQSWTNGCKFQHSGAGENLAAGTGDFNAAAAVKAWVDEWTSYNPITPSHPIGLKVMYYYLAEN